MQLQVGDRFTDESGSWEITTRPTAISGGKYVHARARHPKDPLGPPRDLMWPAHQRVEVVRSLAGLPATERSKRPPVKKSGRK